MLDGVVFSSPGWLWLIPLMIAVVFLWRRAARGESVSTYGINVNSTIPHLYYPATRDIPKGAERKTGPGVTRIIATAALFLLLVFAMAQPERIGEQLPAPLPQRDIIFIVDTSVSMTLRDYVVNEERVSRMTVVKGVLDEFIKNLRGSHLSIVVFGEEAYTYVPLTRDHDVVRTMVARMQTTMAGRFNAIGDGVALAVRNAKANRHTVLVLLTDADRETGRVTPANASRLAKDAGLPLYTIAIGAATQSAEETRTAGLIYQPVNLELLSSMAAETGAKSYRAGAALALKDAIVDIEKREKKKVEQPPRYHRQPLYHWFLYPALLIAALFPLLGIISRCRR